MKNAYRLAIVGGGAAGLFLSSALSASAAHNIALFERGERLGRKLSATGNGQGNVTNLRAAEAEYFSSTAPGKAESLIQKYPPQKMMGWLEERGLLLVADEKGRVYPAGRQASAVTDALRFTVEQQNVATFLGEKITGIEKKNGQFLLTAQTAEGEKKYFAENVVLCTGGKAAKNFGTDGTAYALAQMFGHTVTPLYPSLVQLKTDVSRVKTLKGIRVSPAVVTATWQENGKPRTHAVEGDILFTDYGVSGDAIFRLTAFFTDKIDKSTTLSIDFLPQYTQKQVENALREKRNRYPHTPWQELLCGMVNNQIARAIMKRTAENAFAVAAEQVKGFTLPVTGTLGFDYAQVTKGGISLAEVDDSLQSTQVEGLYFAGEVLDVDGQCGGYNLQWAYSSAMIVAAAISAKYSKENTPKQRK